VTSLNTARGAIDTAHLGVTLMHEHVFILTSEILQNYPEGWAMSPNASMTRLPGSTN
jgi:phosphotriesterase-related protein